MPRLGLPPPPRSLAALGLVIALAGCGRAIRVGGSRDLHVALTEYQLTPENVRAYAGTLTITVRNIGSRTHNLAVTPVGGTGLNAGLTPNLLPGASATLTLDLTPGRYMLRSTVAGDQALGLWGSLNVVAIRHT